MSRQAAVNFMEHVRSNPTLRTRVAQSMNDIDTVLDIAMTEGYIFDRDDWMAVRGQMNSTAGTPNRPGMGQNDPHDH